MVSDIPRSNFLLVSVIIFKYLEAQIANSVFLGQSIVNNLCSGLKFSNPGESAENLPKKQFLLIEKVLHPKIAGFSSSISLSEQYLQIREVTGVTGLVYRPDSIPRFGTALTRYLVSQVRWVLL